MLFCSDIVCLLSTCLYVLTFVPSLAGFVLVALVLAFWVFGLVIVVIQRWDRGQFSLLD